MRRFVLPLVLLSTLIVLFAAACSSEPEGENIVVKDGEGIVNLKGMIEIDGSSTVYPVSEAVAEEFRKTYPKVQVNVGVSGTGGGFKRFTVGETDISNASRPIKDEEKTVAQENGVEYYELLVGQDGISVVVNKANDWATCMTVEELKILWEPGSTVSKWSDIRPEWPDNRINLYGPGTDSGTFDFFTEEIIGEVQASRSDFTMSEDDNVLVIGVNGDRGALGYFGYAYYLENKDMINTVAIDGGEGCVEPTSETIEGGTYMPLARPLLIYVNKASLKKPEVTAFVEYYMVNAGQLVEEVGYVKLSNDEYESELAKIR
ncbi:MAG: phosphate ABC transporter substrate-binding protein [Dehalococcoidia bacterium]|mgnify:FL=1|nr:phosphate ABC transporter substrate-binding protein [Dehalococcoidia bacterium]